MVWVSIREFRISVWFDRTLHCAFKTTMVEVENNLSFEASDINGLYVNYEPKITGTSMLIVIPRFPLLISSYAKR